MSYIASASDISQALLISCRQRKALLSFENTIRLCHALDIDMNILVDCNSGTYDHILGFPSDPINSVGSQFWTLLHDYLQQRGLSWAEASRMGGVPASTIGTARLNSRTLSFDTTLCLLNGLDLSPEGVADHLVLTAKNARHDEDPDASIKREIAREIKHLERKDLESILDYIRYLKSKV